MWSAAALLAQDDGPSPFANAGAPLNSDSDDFSPSLTADGRTLVFNSRRGGREYADLFIAQYVDGRWTEPAPIAELNSEFIDECPYIVPDGSMIFFASNRDGSMESRDAAGRRRVSSDIYVSRRSARGWTPPVAIVGEVNTAATERAPALDQRSGAFYFSRQPIGDIQATRLYQARYERGRFVDVRELPAPINAGAVDTGLTPALDRDGVYFSSRRDGGLGAWDIYFAPLEGGRFGEPRNLGPAINSAGDEIFYNETETLRMFASYRDGGQGRYDLYVQRVQPADVHLLVQDQSDSRSLPGGVEYSLDGSAFVTAATDAEGRLRIPLPVGADQLRVRIYRRGYLPFERDYALQAAQNALQSEDGSAIPDHSLGGERRHRDLIAALAPVQSSARFESRAIRFDYNRAELRADSSATMEKLEQFLKENPSLSIEIVGHTDLHGDADYNLRLSERRAQAVRADLIRRGISAERLQTRGAGMSEPLSPRRGAPHDEANRRTEFRISGGSQAVTPERGQ